MPATTPKPKIIDATSPNTKPDECRFNAVLLACFLDAEVGSALFPPLPASGLRYLHSTSWMFFAREEKTSTLCRNSSFPRSFTESVAEKDQRLRKGFLIRSRQKLFEPPNAS